MKIFKGTRFGGLAIGSTCILTLAFLAGAIFWASPALAGEGNDATNAVAPDPAMAPIPATNQPSAVTLSPGVIEVLKLADAGVSMEVIKTFIESSPVAAQPTGEDVIALKKHNVGDDVVTLLLKRGVEARTAATQTRSEAIAGILANRRSASGGFDPESYDYFRYYYLQPRAVASAYQRLAPYHQPYFARPYRYGYGSSYEFGSSFSGRPVYPGSAPTFRR